MHVRKGDQVVVTAGKEKGKRGRVLRLLTGKGRVVIERVNMVKRHTKPSQRNPRGGILEKEGSVEASNVSLWCGKCAAARRSRHEHGEGEWRPTLHRSQGYRRPLLVGLGVLLLASAVVGGVFYVDRQAVQKAQDLEREAVRFLTVPSAGDAQKADNAVKEAIARYRQIADQYPRTPTAPLALYHLGNMLVQTNDLSAAVEAYQRFLASYASNPSFAGLVQQRLALG